MLQILFATCNMRVKRLYYRNYSRYHRDSTIKSKVHKNINIANFNLGRTGQGEAVSLLELDQYLNDSVINDLQKLNSITVLSQIVAGLV